MTATDYQIDALWRAACGPGMHDVDSDIMHDCTVAVNRHNDFTAADQNAARARCSKILDVTDDQIHELSATQSPVTGNCAYLCRIALGEHDQPDCSRLEARARCALIIYQRVYGRPVSYTSGGTP